MDGPGADKVSTVFLVIIVQIADVLEIVGVQIAFGNACVWQDVIVVLNDFQSVAFFFEVIGDNFEDFGVRGRGSSYSDGCVICAGFGSAPGQGKGRSEGQRQGKYACAFLFHCCSLLYFNLLSNFFAVIMPISWKIWTITTIMTMVMNIIWSSYL